MRARMGSSLQICLLIGENRRLGKGRRSEIRRLSKVCRLVWECGWGVGCDQPTVRCLPRYDAAFCKASQPKAEIDAINFL